MRNWERRLLTASTLLVGLTGVVYLILKYFWTNDDPFALVNHPWQPVALHLHILLAPLLVFAAGLVFTSHVRGHLTSKARHNRRSGLLLIWTFVLMVLSGYSLQVVVGELARLVTLWVHLATGGVFLVGYAIHLVIGLRRPRKQRLVNRKIDRRAA